MTQQDPSPVSSSFKRSSLNGNNAKHNLASEEVNEVDKYFPEYSDQECLQMGVDFVLSLERPHLSHVQIAQPSGQILSMQGTLLQCAPSTLAADTQWEVSAEIFQKLFEMADRLGLNGHITPVQAWGRIRDHENFSRLTRDKLRTLEHNMRPNIRCQGYAAIMEEAIFEILLNQALSS